jgi:hypothetical protein
VTGLGTMTCPSATVCEALATTASGPAILFGSIVASGASTWVTESTFPSGAASITGLSCTTTNCVAIGTGSGTPSAAVWTADLTATPHDWSAATGIPSSVSAVTGVTCGKPAAGDTADCIVVANAAQAASGVLLEGSLSGSWVWNPVTLPTGTSVRFFTGVACEPSPSSTRATCAAVGSTASGPLVVTSGNGPKGTWSTETPATLSGSVVTGIPLETEPTTSSSWTLQVTAGGSGDATTLGRYLYPQPNGYNLAAGQCAAEATSWSITSLTAAPGGSASATVPLALLPLRLVTSAGVPVKGATVTLIPTSGCSGDTTYALPATDAYGLTTTAVPYGTYSYTVTTGGAPVSSTTTLNLTSASSVTLGGGTTATDYLPGPVTVPSS